jgi:hypothetical protein
LLGNNRSVLNAKERCPRVIEVVEFTGSDFREIGVDLKVLECRAHNLLKSEVALSAV